ncbi:hypothetical protein N8445_00050 [bacterium]|nr:hypothetical protein [bacterium]
MKLNQLRKIIREEVRSAVKEELQDILNEAVKVASTPINEYKQPEVVVPKPSPTTPVAGKKSLEQMLQQTKSSMTNEDYRTVINGTSNMVNGMPNMASSMSTQMGINAGKQPGIDISNLDFVKKAGAILDASNQKDKAKAGQLI